LLKLNEPLEIFVHFTILIRVFRDKFVVLVGSSLLPKHSPQYFLFIYSEFGESIVSAARKRSRRWGGGFNSIHPLHSLAVHL